MSTKPNAKNSKYLDTSSKAFLEGTTWFDLKQRQEYSKRKVRLNSILQRDQDDIKLMEETMALKKQHISLFSDNAEVLDYTNKLRNCVKDITETTMVIPHLNA